jgi:acetyl esterase/lipase
MMRHCCRFALVAALVLSPLSALAQPPERDKAEFRKIAEKYDKDGNGKLSPEEKQAIRKDVLEGRLEVPPWLREMIQKGPGQPGKQPPVPENVVIERDLVYGDAGNRPLKLDLIRPKEKGDAPRPAIVFIHGGGWRGGNKESKVAGLVPFAASGKYVCASIDYRLSGEAIWPAQIHDCKAAIRWVRANAEKYNIDPNKIGVWGGSAGGHLVAMLGASGDVECLEGKCGSPDQSSRVTCVVNFFGPTDLATGEHVQGGKRPSAVDMLLGGKIEEKQDLAKEASPITHVDAKDAPMLTMHGTKDPVVPISHGERIHDALTKAGVESVLVKVEGAGHGFGGPEVDERVRKFFARHLLGEDVKVQSETIEASPRR